MCTNEILELKKTLSKRDIMGEKTAICPSLGIVSWILWFAWCVANRHDSVESEQSSRLDEKPGPFRERWTCNLYQRCFLLMMFECLKDLFFFGDFGVVFFKVLVFLLWNLTRIVLVTLKRLVTQAPSDAFLFGNLRIRKWVTIPVLSYIDVFEG